MSKADKTKLLIIEKTAPIFNTKGYAATSMSDITNATGLTKGSIYGNFANKEEVVLEAFKHNVISLQYKINEAINSDTDEYQQLINFIEFYREHWESIILTGGCAMLNAATEADDHLLFLKDTVQQHFLGWQNKIYQILENGKKNGYFKKEVSSNDYSYLMIMLIEGAILLSRTLNDKGHLHIALDHLIKIVNQEIKI